MKPPLKLIPMVLAAGWLSSGTASAGSFTTDFSTFPTVTIGGGAFLETNRYILTVATNNQAGSLTVWDSALDNGQAIESFTAAFKLQIGPGSGNAADGVSFNFGANVTDGGVYNEEGQPTSGGTLANALTIEFDIYDNGGGEAPAVDVRFNNVEIAHHPFQKSDMVTSKLEDVYITVKRSGMVSVSYKGQVIHTNVFVQSWAPVAGLFNVSGRTGGEYAFQALGSLTINTVLTGPPVAVTIAADPVSATVQESATASTNFTVVVGADGSAPFSFQWLKNNVPIPDATNATLTLSPIHYVDNNAKIKCQVTNAVATVTSGEATLTVIPDTTPPTVVRAGADTMGTRVQVVFSEPVTDTALTPSNYRLSGGINVLSVTRVDASTVALTTSQMPQGQSFTLTINGVQDTASSPNTIAANTQISFRTVLFQVGSVLHKKYLNFPDNLGYDPNNLFNDPRYPNNPDRQELMAAWEYPANGLYRDQNTEPDGAAHRLYCDTLEGYFIPATTGDYVVITDGADNVYTFLSTDSDPANMHRVSEVPGGWTNPRDWLIPQSPIDPKTGQSTHQNDGQTNNMRSDYLSAAYATWPDRDPITGGAKITLTAGQKYYMLSVHYDHSWSGADDFAATFIRPGDAIPAPGTAPAFTGNLVGAFLDPTGASVSFVQQPTNTTILQGRKATFYGFATGQSRYGTNVTYQWQTAPSGSTTFTNIPGATGPSYTTPAMALSDNGRQYQLMVSVPGFSELSSIATLTVIADTIPPHLVAASAIASPSGSTFDVGVTFDEPLDVASATVPGNYGISGGTISAVKYYPQSPGVVLTVSGLTVGSSYTLTVVNVADPYGNKMSSTPIALGVGSLQWGEVGADELKLGYAVLAVSTNSFDLYSDGIGEWAAYDEATFVYEQITGDFDKEVRVEYQDPSSEWARAGLIVRDVTSFGVDRNGQTTNSLAGRYQKVHVNPVMTAMGTPGNNAYEGNRRLQTGGPTDSGITSGANTAAPAYPNAWCRLQRVGQTLNLFRSSDGVTWTQIGTSTFDGTFPTTAYVGMEYAPENGNVDAALRSVWVAKYRDYRTHSAVVTPPVMTWVRTPTGLTITYEGTLQSNTNLTNPSGWAPVPGANSPYPVTPSSGPPKFYRAAR